MLRGGLALSILALVLACADRHAASSERSASGKALKRTPEPDIGPELRDRLQAALQALGPKYVPRTRHLGANGKPKYVNRLILETSPYLLQHAHNPVNWFPWGDEAFAIARAAGRPVFLSVGYSTCHWCHVMEEESFEDEEIARFMNAHYVCIKVDREERPDIDAVYMTAVQMLSGSGGWPMSAWLTPAREPFFGGTYFPPRDGARGARRGFLTLLGEQFEVFRKHPNDVARRAAANSDSIRRAMAAAPAAGLPGERELEEAVRVAERRYDADNGGARGAPKFPSSLPLRLLLRHYARTQNAHSLEMAVNTLAKMAAGGMYDHVGGGFHRYSVDARWLVPHFEKMLYDNALLAIAYLEGFQASGRADFARVARETLDYVLREMTAPEGGFWSATDADSLTPGGHREEGYFFTWTPSELRGALSAEQARAVEAYYAVTPGGNFEGRSILYTPQPRDDVARELGVARSALDRTLAEALSVLRSARQKRPQPLLDDKIQASWNGLMLSALARGALVLGEPRFGPAAERAAAFVVNRLRPGGKLRHALMRGRTTSAAFLDDYAFLAAGLLDVFELSAEPRFLEGAIALMEELEQRHADAVNGGYFSTASDHEKLLTREKPDYDGAIPSGNSVALLNQLRLHELTGEQRFRDRAETSARAFSSALSANPAALGEMLLAVDWLHSVPLEIALVLPAGAASVETAPGASELVSVLARSFVPNRVTVIASQDALAGRVGELVPWTRDKPAKAGRARAYVCVKGACDLPTNDPAVFRRQLMKRAWH